MEEENRRGSEWGKESNFVVTLKQREPGQRTEITNKEAETGEAHEKDLRSSSRLFEDQKRPAKKKNGQNLASQAL